VVQPEKQSERETGEEHVAVDDARNFLKRANTAPWPGPREAAGVGPGAMALSFALPSSTRMS
jgi:hypothetical protein